MSIARSLTLVLLVCLLSAGSYANKKSKSKRPPPKIILVQLFSETSRMKALEKAGRYRDIEILKKDRREVQAATIKDFSENFDFCPVYFFTDNNFQAIIDQQFEGILLDSAMKPVQNVTVSDTNYYIVYYGFPTWQSHKNKMEVTSQTNVGSKPNGWGLIVNNYKMKQIGYTYMLRNPVSLFRKGKMRRNRYVSKKFDIEYYPLAEDLDAKLKAYAGEYKMDMEQKEQNE